MRWQFPEPIVIPEDFRQFVGGHLVIAERLFRSGINEISTANAFLHPDDYQLTSPFELPDVEGAVTRIRLAISNKELILIWGDFDVDGQTATTLLFTALQKLGANVKYHVPLRDGEGHGIHLPKLLEWLTRDVKVIITCDTGITAHEAVNIAQSAGVDVIITDHHLLGETLPNALAVINPMRLPMEHPLRELPGVAVAYELIYALNDGKKCDELLDLVALGIVADVARQIKETRYLLQRGIAVMRTSTRIGLNKLIEYAKLNPLEIDESEIGFGLGPRLNAQGRLSDAADSVELLATSDMARAAVLANQLEGMNAQRKLESSFVQASAESLLENDPTLLTYAVIVLSHPEWKGGVVGIVANRLADKYHKPVVMLCEENEAAFGSARSVIGINITDAIRACREILNKFGGHAMAAGVSLSRKNIGDFRRMLSRTVREMLPDSEVEPILEIDGELQLNEISMELVTDIRRLAPFGNGNPPLNLVSRNLKIARKKKLGKSGENYEIIVEDEAGNRQRVHWWNAGELPKVRFDLAYNLSIDRFGKAPEVVLGWRDAQLLEAEQIEIITNERAYEIIDYRAHPTPKNKLEEVRLEFPDAVIWSEGDQQIVGMNRTELLPSENLIVWTAPAGTQEWQDALELVAPTRIIIFRQIPAPLSVEVFLSKLGGMIKYTINAKRGRVKIDAMAAALAQRAEAIKQGLKWYEATGQLGIDWLPRGEVLMLQKAEEPRPQIQLQIENLLKNILAETEIYRTSEYFKTR